MTHSFWWLMWLIPGQLSTGSPQPLFNPRFNTRDSNCCFKTAETFWMRGKISPQTKRRPTALFSSPRHNTSNLGTAQNRDHCVPSPDCFRQANAFLKFPVVTKINRPPFPRAPLGRGVLIMDAANTSAAAMWRCHVNMENVCSTLLNLSHENQLSVQCFYRKRNVVLLGVR